jgi:hypothetical protein
MLFNPYYRKGGGQIGILGSGKADQGYGLPIGVQFFAALGSEANIIRAMPPGNIPGQVQVPDNIDRHRRRGRLRGRAGGGCRRMDSGGKSHVLQVGKVERAHKGF